MAWMLAAAMMMAADPTSVALAPPGPACSRRHEPSTKPYAERWEHRRERLTTTVIVFGAMTGLGAVMLAVPFASDGGGEDATPIFPIMATGAALFTAGGTVTTVFAPWLGHHLRWDAPAGDDGAGPAHDVGRSREHSRRLKISLGAEGGIVLAGGLGVGIGYIASSRCETGDHSCENRRLAAGAIPGYTLVGLGSLAMVSTGILLGLQKRHWHAERLGPRLVAVSPTGLTMRF